MKRKRSLGSTHPNAEQSHNCRGWIDHYGQSFRKVVGCGRALVRLQNAKSKNVDFGFVVQQCASVLREASAPDRVHGIAVVANCVRRGYSHGVTQPKRK